MKKHILLFLTITLSGGVVAQNDSSDKAEALLQKTYEKFKSHKQVSIQFNYTLENTPENIHQEASGSVDIEGDKYCLRYMGITKIFDGKKIYTIVPDNEEVNISNHQGDDTQEVSPSNMLAFYQEGYTYKWDILQSIPGRKIQYVELHPIKTNSEVKQILIGVDNKTFQLYTIIQIGKNSTKTVIDIEKYNTNTSIPADVFLFDRKYYEDTLNYYIEEI